MYEAVEVARRLLNRLPHLVVTIQVEDICDEVEGILIVLNFGVQAGEVEPVCQVILVDFAKVLVPARRNELGFKCQLLSLGIRWSPGRRREKRPP
jgi:hypothetical protein